MVKISLIKSDQCTDLDKVKQVISLLTKDFKILVEELEPSSDKGHYFIDVYDIRKCPGILVNDQYFAQGLILAEELKAKIKQSYLLDNNKAKNS